MDHSLAHIIAPMLKQLQATKHGAPNVDDEDVPEELKATSAPELSEEDKNCGSPDANHFKRWDWVLNEMIWAFEQHNEDWEAQFSAGEIDHVMTPIDKNDNEVAKEDADYFRMDHGPNHTYEVDWDARKAYGERIQNGFRLFGKYYQNLWD